MVQYLEISGASGSWVKFNHFSDLWFGEESRSFFQAGRWLDLELVASVIGSHLPPVLLFPTLNLQVNQIITNCQCCNHLRYVETLRC